MNLRSFGWRLVVGMGVLFWLAIAIPSGTAAGHDFHVVFLIGEQEYQTARTLTAFADQELVPRGVDCRFALVDPKDPNRFPGLDALDGADLLIVSVRRRTPSVRQMTRIRRYLDAGGAVLGIRTASHAFDREVPDAQHVRWENFDNEILGGDYQGHYGNKPPHDPRSHISMTPAGRGHPIFSGLTVTEFRSTAHLYRNRDLSPRTTVLLQGQLVGGGEVEPVAWTYTTPSQGRAFYTSLGDPEDFEKRPFRSSLLGAIYWCADREVPNGSNVAGAPQALRLDLQRRSAVTGAVEPFTEQLPVHRIGIVGIDMWNWHWCKTSTARVATMVPRMNAVLAQARKMGIQVFWCPTDAVNSYNGWHQREIAVAHPGQPLPDGDAVECPPARDGGGCTCGPERCRGNFGWDGMHPDLEIHRDDLMPNAPEVLYAFCRERGITHLIYLGVHTQACLLGKSVGVSNMLRAGMRCILARDLTDAHGVYLPEQAYTPDDLTQDVIEHFETHLIPTVNLTDTVMPDPDWAAEALVDSVRMAPWGTLRRPHHFESTRTLTLTIPEQSGAVIYYTIDGSRPGEDSVPYTEPIVLRETTRLRAVAYRKGQAVSRETEGWFVKRNQPIPLPDVYLSDREARSARGPGHSYSRDSFRLEPFRKAAQWDRSNVGESIRMAGKEYPRGVGVHAVNQLVYELEPEDRRFVALAGIDEAMLRIHSGSNLARHSSVVFRVFLDGRLRAESPVMRIGEEPWRFDVGIPKGSRTMSLVATDAGDGTKGDYANWANAGFLRER